MLYRKWIDNIGQVIKEERNKLELSQQELADQIAVDQATISLIESGRRLPGLEMLALIADGLSLTTSQLIKKAEKY